MRQAEMLINLSFANLYGIQSHNSNLNWSYAYGEVWELHIGFIDTLLDPAYTFGDSL